MAHHEEKGGYCAQCEKPVLVRRPGTSHVLHLILSVLSCGLWLPVWALTAIKVGGWRCPHCGGQALGYVPLRIRMAELQRKAETPVA